MLSLGYLYMVQERYEQAANLFARKTEYSNREIQGKDHPKTLAYMNGPAVLYKEQGRYDDAERLLSEAAKSRRLRLGDTRPHTSES